MHVYVRRKTTDSCVHAHDLKQKIIVLKSSVQAKSDVTVALILIRASK
jgi:hypothetical protein